MIFSCDDLFVDGHCLAVPYVEYIVVLVGF
jgi:hypothetical protein